jgi:hypothetical protein
MKNHLIKTGYSILFLMALWLLFFNGKLMAQEPQFVASAKAVVVVGERFQLQYRFTAEGVNFKGPIIKDFNTLSGPSPSTSSSVQIINGQVSREVSYTFTYILEAFKEGKFVIPPATITYNNKQYSSNGLTISVNAGRQAPSSGQSPQQGGQQQQSTADIDVFLKAEISNVTPYIGEQIIISYKLYFNNQIAGHDGFQKLSSFPGFWVKDLLANQRDIPTKKEVYKNKQYNMAEVRRFALFPQRAGEIEIIPKETDLTVRVQTASRRRSSDSFFDSFFNDPFFNSRYSDVKKKIVSNGFTINVKPTPTKDKPDNFSGAVGTFTMKSQIDNTEVKANEPITIKLTVQGAGNIELFDLPNIVFPTDFEVFDPEMKSDIKVANTGVSGTRTFEYLIIPRNPGNFKIKPIEFSSFNPAQGAYNVQRSPEYSITVQRGDGSSSVITYGGTVRQEGIQIIGSDIRHIKLSPYNFSNIGVYFFRSYLYYLLLIIPFLLTIAILIIWRKEMKKRADVELMRNLKSNKIARKRLKQANIFMKAGNENEFYNEIARASWGYLSDKLNIPVSELSMDNVNSRLLAKGLKEETIQQFIETLKQTEFARFAPGTKDENMERLYSGALEIITKIEKELK